MEIPISEWVFFSFFPFSLSLTELIPLWGDAQGAGPSSPPRRIPQNSPKGKGQEISSCHFQKWQVTPRRQRGHFGSGGKAPGWPWKRRWEPPLHPEMGNNLSTPQTQLPAPSQRSAGLQTHGDKREKNPSQKKRISPNPSGSQTPPRRGKARSHKCA